MNKFKKLESMGNKLKNLLLVSVIISAGCDKTTTTNKAEVVQAKVELTQAQKDSIAESKKIQQMEITIPSKDLYYHYDENEVKADEYFKGKEFYVQGKITTIANDIMDNPYITLETNNSFSSVQCSFEDKKIVADLKKGQEVTVFGKCKGKMMNILMDDCVLAENYKLKKR